MVFSQITGSRASIHTAVVWEDSYLQKESHPPPSPFPPCIAECDIRWYGISLWLVSVCCPGDVPSPLLTHHKLAGSGGFRESLGAMPATTIVKTLMRYQCCSSYTCRAEHCMGCYRESELHPSQTQYMQGKIFRKEFPFTTPFPLLFFAC